MSSPNPYAPPAALVEPVVSTEPLAEVGPSEERLPWGPLELLGRAWSLARRHPGVLLGAGAAVSAVTFVPVFVSLVATGIDTPVSPLGSMLSESASTALLALFLPGLLRQWRDADRGAVPQVRSFLDELPLLTRVLPLAALSAGIDCLFVLVEGSGETALTFAAEGGSLVVQTALWTLLFLPAMLHALETGRGTFAALGAAGRAAAASAGRLLGVMVLGLALMFGGMLACGVGMFVTVALSLGHEMLAWFRNTGRAAGP